MATSKLAAAEKGTTESNDGLRSVVDGWVATAFWSPKAERAVPIVETANGEYPRQIHVRDLISAAGGEDNLAQLPVYAACVAACEIATAKKAEIKAKYDAKQAEKAAKNGKAPRNGGPLTERVNAAQQASALSAA